MTIIRPDIGLIYSLLTVKCIDLLLIIDFSAYFKLNFSTFICLLFIVLFAISCTKQKKKNYLSSHGEEAQEKPLGFYGMGSLG